MLIRKFVIAGLVLAAVGLTIAATTGVIGQQPGAVEKNDGAVEKAVPAAGSTESAADGFSRTAPPAAEDSRLSRGQEGTEEGTAADPSGAGAGLGVEAPPLEAGLGGLGGGVQALPAGSGSAAGAAPGKAKGPSKSSAKPRSGRMMRGMPGAGMSGDWMSEDMMPGRGMGGGMPVPVPEDELETWVNQALADYAQTEDQAARKQQRELIAQALDQIFDIRQERRMGELETLEQRVQKLRGTLETREKLKSDILKNRLDYLIREADGLGWGDGLPAPTGFGAGSSSGPSSGFKPLKRNGGIGAGSGPPASGAGSEADRKY